MWQFGLSMLPSSVYAATVQPPAQTGMNAQSRHSFHADSASNRDAACGARRLLPPVDVADRLGGVAGEARAGVERAVGADGVGVAAMDLARPHVDAVDGREAALPGLLAQERHLIVEHVGSCRSRCSTAAPAPVMHAPFSGLSATAVSAMNFAPLTAGVIAGAGGSLRSRMTGLNATFDSWSAKSCSLRKSSSAG